MIVEIEKFVAKSPFSQSIRFNGDLGVGTGRDLSTNHKMRNELIN